MPRPEAFIWYDDRSKGRGYYHMLHRRRALLDGLQDASGTDDCRVKKILDPLAIRSHLGIYLLTFLISVTLK